MELSLNQHLTEMLEPVVEDLGYELLLVEFGGSGRSSTLRLYIDSSADSPDGISVEDCERVSREVASTLDVEDPIGGAYQLEVSSPGLDRPLVKPEHFERFRGERARLQMRVPLDGQRRFVGVLEGCQENVVLLRNDGGELMELPLSGIERARLVPDWQKERPR